MRDGSHPTRTAGRSRTAGGITHRRGGSRIAQGSRHLGSGGGHALITAGVECDEGFKRFISEESEALLTAQHRMDRPL